MKLCLQKNAKFSSAGGSQTPVPPAAGAFAPNPPDLHWPPAAGGSAPRPPKQPPPPLRISGYAPAHFYKSSNSELVQDAVNTYKLD